MSDKHWSMKTALEQITKCDFKCESGPLSGNIAWQWLLQTAKVGPEFLPGQGVFYEVKAEAGGATLSKWIHYYVVGCHMDSDNNDRYWVYHLSNNPPGPYHYGTVHHKSVRADKLRLKLPIPEGIQK